VAKDKLGREDLEELKELTKAYRYFKHATRSLELYNNLWKNQKLREKKLDGSKGYEINLDTGVIKVVGAENKETLEVDGTKGN